MKKVILILAALLTVSALFAQKSNVNKARNKAFLDPPDYDGAITAINAALQDSTTKNDVQTWYTAGLIYYQKQSGEASDIKLMGESIIKSINYFRKASELDQLPNAKGKIKPKYNKDIKERVTEMSNVLIQYATNLFDENDNKKSFLAFREYVEIPTIQAFKNQGFERDTNYVKFKLKTAYIASKVNEHNITIAYCEDLKHAGYLESTVYMMLNDEYQLKKDSSNYLRILREGIERFPSEPYFVQHLINHYIRNNKSSLALEYLNKAITREPFKMKYYLIRGNLYRELNKVDEAKNDYEKALEIKSDNIDDESEALFGLGLLKYNKGVEINNSSQNLNGKEYNDGIKKANDLYKESLPFFQKARSITPKDIDVLKALKQVYYRLQMKTEENEVTAKLKSL